MTYQFLTTFNYVAQTCYVQCSRQQLSSGYSSMTDSLTNETNEWIMIVHVKLSTSCYTEKKQSFCVLINAWFSVQGSVIMTNKNLVCDGSVESVCMIYEIYFSLLTLKKILLAWKLSVPLT